MVSLTDLAPSTRSVRVGGDDVPVMGISALGVAALLRDFPSLATAFVSGEFKMDAESLSAFGPQAVAAIIAAGCGSPGDPKAIAVASNFPVGLQVEFLAAIAELTMPDGPGPFMAALDSLIARLDFGDRGKAPASKSASPSKP